MSLNDQEYINDYLINHKTQNNSNLNTTKLTEISQIMNCIDQKQNYPNYQMLDNSSPVLTSNYKDNNEQLFQQIEGTPYNLMNMNFQQNNSNLSSMPHTEMKTEQHPYFSNISPVSRFQTKINMMGQQYPVTGSARSSQITPSNSSSVLQQQNNLTNPFTPSNILPNKKNNLYPISVPPQTTSFSQNNTNNSSRSSISNSRLNINRINNNNIDSIKGDENQYNLSNNISYNNQNLNFNKYQLSQNNNNNNNKLFFKNELSPNQKQNASTIKLLAKIKNEDELNYQSEMVQVDQYLSKVYNQKMNNSREEIPPNFGAILAKRTSPPLKGKNIQNSKSNTALMNSNNSQNQSGILQFTTIQSQQNLGNNNSISGLMSNNNNNQSGTYGHISNIQNSSQKYLNHQSVLNQTNDSVKNKSAYGIFGLKDERSIQESKAYLQAMRALQERIKELEKQLSLKNENEIRLHIESQFQQSLEESSEIIENLNNKNIILEQEIGNLLNEIQQYKNVINEREKEFQQQREEWLKGNSERNAIIESHIQKQSQLSTQLQEEIERNHQLQIEINETQQKWQLLHQDHQMLEAKRIEQLQRDLDDEKSQHNELKALCVKSSEEIETLLAQNKALDHKLQIREKEFDEYRIQYNQGHVDLLKDQIREQKEYLDKIEDKIKQNYETKLQQLENDLNYQKQIEKQLRNELKENQKNKLQKHIEQFNQSINSPAAASNNKTNNQRIISNNLIGNDQEYLQQNQVIYQQQQQYNNSNFNSIQENNSQSELEKYLSPKQNVKNQQKNQGNLNNNEMIVNLNQEFQGNNNSNGMLQMQQKSLQNQNKFNNFQGSNQQLYQQQSQQNSHYRGNSNQVNEIENFSLQEESDLLNFDYDEIQTQSRMNSKNSPNIYSKISNQIISLDSPLRKRSKNNNDVISSSLQITKQFQNVSNANQYSFMLPNSSHENNELIIGSPQSIQQFTNISPFYNPHHNNYPQNHQQSPDFKNKSSQQNLNKNMPQSKEFQRIQSPERQSQIDNMQNNQISFHSINNNQYNQSLQNQELYNMRQPINNQNERVNQKYQQSQASSYLQYSDAINKELEYKKQLLAQANKRSKSQNQSQHTQQQLQIIKLHKNSADNLHHSVDEQNLDYPSNQIGQELIRDIFEAESELKLLNQRYEVLLTESRNEENSKKKSEIRKELITINEKIKILNEKLYVLKKREKFIMNQQFQKAQNPQHVSKMQMQDDHSFQYLNQQQQFQDPYQNLQYNQQ